MPVGKKKKEIYLLKGLSHFYLALKPLNSLPAFYQMTFKNIKLNICPLRSSLCLCDPLLPLHEVIGWYAFITDVCYYTKACLIKNKYRFVEK